MTFQIIFRGNVIQGSNYNRAKDKSVALLKAKLKALNINNVTFFMI